jgi:hypothetical protein
VSRAARTVAWIVFWATLLVALLLGLFVAWVLSEGLPPGTVITVDDERFVMPALTETGHWLLLALAVLAAALVLVIVLPIVVALAVFVPLVAGSLGLLVGLAALAVVLLPFVLLLRWLWKAQRKTTTIPPS